MDDIIEKERSYKNTGCIFDVHNEVGPGLHELCYQSSTGTVAGLEAIDGTIGKK